MFTAQIKIQTLKKAEIGKQSDLIYSLLVNLTLEGRILDSDLTVTQESKVFKSTVNIPEKDVFKNLKKSKYISSDFKKLKDLGLSQPSFTVLGEVIESSKPCICKNSSAYILFTNYLSIDSPILCFDCGSPVTLYKIPQNEPQQFRLALGWQKEYKACDLLQMHCGFGERFGIKQMSDLSSGLSKTGLKICADIKMLTNKNCYYYLYRSSGRSWKMEKERKCPNCKGEWILDTEFFKIFDFRCDKCHLLSNIAFSLR